MEKKYHLLERLKQENITSINTGYRTYDLNIKRVLKDSGNKCYGITDFDAGFISLERDMDHETAKETLLHELCHIALEICGLGGNEETGIVREHTNEELTTQVSRGFLLLMNLNPRLFEIINERLRT
jgi:hypothetical protein